ncbi:MAG: oligosaccharide flippase family protein [Oligoflexus sp.]
MSDLYRRAIANVMRLGLSLMTTMGLGLILRILLPRVFGVEQMGLFYFAESICYITFTFLSLGVHAYIHREIPGRVEEAKRSFWPVLQFKSIYAIILGLILYLYLLFKGYDSVARNLIMVFAIHHFLQTIVIEYMKPYLLALDHVSLVAKIEISSKIIQVLGVVGVILLQLDLYQVVWAFALTSLVPVLMILVFVHHHGWLQQKFQWSICSDVIKMGLPFFINGALLTLYSNIDIAILGEIGNQVEVGLYGAAVKLKGVLLMVVPLLSSAILPILSRTKRDDEQAYEQFLCHLYRILVVASFPAAAYMVLFSQEIVSLLYGAEFIESAWILSILAPVVLFTYINVFLSMNMTLVSNGKLLTILTLLAVALNAILNFVLIPIGLEWRAVGGGGAAASLTTLLAEALTFVGLLYLTPTRILRGRTLLETILVAIPLAAMLFALEQLMGLSLLHKCFAALAVLFYMILSGMIRRSDLLEIRQLIKAGNKS